MGELRKLLVFAVFRHKTLVSDSALHTYLTMTEGGAKEVISLNVTPEQRDTIRALFFHTGDTGWDYEIAISEANSILKQESQQGAQPMVNQSSRQSPAVRVVREAPNHWQPVELPQDLGLMECPYCLCSPCITDEMNRQLWWENEHFPPNNLNNIARKAKYKYFWAMMAARDIWEDPRYKARKQQALGMDPRRHQYVYHRRDLMPDCVLKKVRNWHPNPGGRPYMGHYWY